MSFFEEDSIATCIGCGCTDVHACMPPCSWLAVDYDKGEGVCSYCPEKLQEYRERAAIGAATK